MSVLIGFVVALLVGVPVGFVLLVAGLVFALQTGSPRMLASFSSMMFNALEIFDLLAIPLFVLLGEVMNEGGITRRLVAAAGRWLRRVPHALLHVNLVANLVLASIMGSAVAQIAVMSRVMGPMLERRGYDRAFAAALTAAAGMLGPVVPPSMMFIIFGVVGEVSIARLFLGGIVPGLLLFVGFTVWTALSAGRRFPLMDRGQPEPGGSGHTLAVLVTSTIPAVIIGGISAGLMTPTESAAVATALAVVIGGVVFRELRLRSGPDVLERAVLNTGIVLLLVATAKVFGWVLVYWQIPQAIAALMRETTADPVVFMLLVFGFLSLVGMVLDAIAALIILVPILLPVARDVYGIDPVHFGIVVCLTLTAGLLTPPVGTGLYIAAALNRVPIGPLTRELVPFLLVTGVVIVLVIVAPWTVDVFQ